MNLKLIWVTYAATYLECNGIPPYIFRAESKIRTHDLEIEIVARTLTAVHSLSFKDFKFLKSFFAFQVEETILCSDQRLSPVFQKVDFAHHRNGRIRFQGQAV